MPLVNWTTKADFDQWYDIGAEGAWGHPNTRSEIRLKYHRFVLLPWMRERAKKLVAALGWTASTRLAIIGAGFGWTAEILQNELGIGTVVAVDTSAYVQASKDLNEDADYIAAITAVGLNANVGDGLTLLNAFRGDGGPRARHPIRNDNVQTGGGRASIRSAIGGAPFNFEVMTEDVLSSLTDAEAQALSSALHTLTNGRVSHLVGEYPLPFSPNTAAQWKVLLPNDAIVKIGTYEVL